MFWKQAALTNQQSPSPRGQLRSCGVERSDWLFIVIFYFYRFLFYLLKSQTFAAFQSSKTRPTEGTVHVDFLLTQFSLQTETQPFYFFLCKSIRA